MDLKAAYILAYGTQKKILVLNPSLKEFTDEKIDVVPAIIDYESEYWAMIRSWAWSADCRYIVSIMEDRIIFATGIYWIIIYSGIS